MISNMQYSIRLRALHKSVLINTLFSCLREEILFERLCSYLNEIREGNTVKVLINGIKIIGIKINGTIINGIIIIF